METPLPTPFSVICSPSHVTNIVPAVKIRPMTMKFVTEVSVTNPSCVKELKPKVIPIDWTKPKIRVNTRVAWFNLRRPTSPCFDHSTNFGTISICKSWITMEAVIYGETPMAKIEKFCMALPLTIFNMFRKGSSEMVCNRLASTPGTVMWAPKRKTNSAKIVKKSFERISFTLNESRNSLIIRSPRLIRQQQR